MNLYADPANLSRCQDSRDFATFLFCPESSLLPNHRALSLPSPDDLAMLLLPTQYLHELVGDSPRKCLSLASSPIASIRCKGHSLRVRALWSGF
jgi:hypothetical protein